MAQPLILISHVSLLGCLAMHPLYLYFTCTRLHLLAHVVISPLCDIASWTSPDTNDNQAHSSVPTHSCNICPWSGPTANPISYFSPIFSIYQSSHIFFCLFTVTHLPWSWSPPHKVTFEWLSLPGFFFPAFSLLFESPLVCIVSLDPPGPACRPTIQVLALAWKSRFLRLRGMEN